MKLKILMKSSKLKKKLHGFSELDPSSYSLAGVVLLDLPLFTNPLVIPDPIILSWYRKLTRLVIITIKICKSSDFDCWRWYKIWHTYRINNTRKHSSWWNLIRNKRGGYWWYNIPDLVTTAAIRDLEYSLEWMETPV